MTAVAYDTGALIAADRSDRAFWADHRARLESGTLPVVPAPVLAQASRSSQQVQLHRLLRGCEVVPLTEADAHSVGHLLGLARVSDVVDATVVHVAVARDADIVTSDRVDLQALIDAAGSRIQVNDV